PRARVPGVLRDHPGAAGVIRVGHMVPDAVDGGQRGNGPGSRRRRGLVGPYRWLPGRRDHHAAGAERPAPRAAICRTGRRRSRPWIGVRAVSRRALRKIATGVDLSRWLKTWDDLPRPWDAQ